MLHSSYFSLDFNNHWPKNANDVLIFNDLADAQLLIEDLFLYTCLSGGYCEVITNNIYVSIIKECLKEKGITVHDIGKAIEVSEKSTYINFDLERYKAAILLDKLTAKYILTSNTLVGERSINQHYHYLANQSIRNNVTLRDSFNYSEGELPNLIAKINEGKEHYEDEFVHYNPVRENENFQLIKINDITNKSDLLTKAKEDITALENLRNGYITSLNQEYDLSKSQTVSKLSKLNNQLSDIKVKLLEFELKYGKQEVTKPGLLNFSKFDKDRYSEFKIVITELTNALQVLEIPYIAGAINLNKTNISDLQNEISIIENKIPEIEQVLDKGTRENIHRINHINDSRFVFTSLHSEMLQLLESLNMNGMYTKKLECNARSSVMQLAYMEQLLQELGSDVYQLSKIPQLYAWKQFYANQEESTKSIFNFLMAFPSATWEYELSNIYYRSMIQDKYPIGRLVNREEYDVLKARLNTVIDQVDTYYTTSKDNMINEVIKTLKTLSPATYNEVSRDKRISPSAWQEASSLTQLKGCTLNAKGAIPINELHILIKMNGLHSPLIRMQILSEHEGNYESQQFSKQLIDDVPVTQRASHAKILATSLSSLTDKIKIYQLPSANIICIDNGQLSKALLEEFLPKGLKEIPVGKQLNDRLIECLLMTNRQQYLVYCDGIINEKHVDHIWYQIRLIDAFKHAGYNLVNLFTSETLGDIITYKSMLRAAIKV